MAGSTLIKRKLRLRVPNGTVEATVNVSATAITGGVTATSEPAGSIALDTTANALFVSDGSLWQALATATQSVGTSDSPTFVGLTLTGNATIAGTILAKDFTEIVAATNVIAAAETGSVFFLNSATEFVSTLPAPAAGLHFTFIVTAAPSGASYTIVTNSSSNIIKGQLATVDVNSVTDPDFEVTGCDTITFVDSKAVAGDQIEVFCDGTNWFAYGQCSVFDAITFTTAS